MYFLQEKINSRKIYQAGAGETDRKGDKEIKIIVLQIGAGIEGMVCLSHNCP